MNPLHDTAVSIVWHSARLLRRLLGVHPKEDLGAQQVSRFEKAGKFDQRFAGFSVEGKTVLEIGSGYGSYVRHACEDLGAAFVHGIEFDSSRAEMARKYLSSSRIENFRIHVCDARQMDEIADKSIDIIVTDAVLEHIQHTDQLLREAFRVLKPGGRMYFSFSPPWFNYNGGHLWRYIPIPWVHIFFSSGVIVDVLRRQAEKGEIAPERIENMIGCYTTLAKLSVGGFLRFVEDSRFHTVKFEQTHGRGWKRSLVNMTPRLFGEVLAGGVRGVLEKPHARDEAGNRPEATEPYSAVSGNSSRAEA